ncbi:2-keto-4-pentenoate hydratase/2-oxohepta-3-ene-1,7-dioic acid hydratase in catechol pathway [Rhodococcus sp. LBL1]|nr:2-keto-4-pentenoate hydratase/2-oxohepta-3-ene-1,7-dioic acid hydratase in catechol pathway [Rhodococcus sp. LBL1]MDH6685136.1 2-keto-4-pentenoate hydratase/2-oxohepta-3-ene-1,7-dioic acid hydratase in catechol pathway [Rhodococcus sp. LBL2]
MRLYSTDEGVAREDRDGILTVLDLPYKDIGTLLDGPGIEAARTASAVRKVPLDGVSLQPVVARPGKILVVGLNYPSHAEETLERFASLGRRDVVLPTEPNFHIAAGSAVIGHRDPIVLPTVASTHVDYEGELGVVIGCAAKNVNAHNAWRHVAGLTVINDISARDIQRRAYAGDPVASIGVAKSFDSFKPIGPCLVTAEEFSERVDLHIQTRVNGQLRQSDRTGTFIHPIPHLISYLSQFHTLEVGDVIATGSPRGAGQFSEHFLHVDDLVEVEVERIGTLANRIARP